MRVLSRLLRVLLATLISFMSLAVIAQTPAAAADEPSPADEHDCTDAVELEDVE